MDYTRRAFFLVLGLLICSAAYATNYQMKYNPQTGRGDWVVADSSLTIDASIYLASTSIDTSAELAVIMTDEIGAAGKFILANGNTLTAGNILVADGSNLNPVAVSGDVTIDSDGAVTVVDDSHNHVITNIDAFTSEQLATQVSDETGTGPLVLAEGSSLIAPYIGAATGESLVVTGSVSAESYTATGTTSQVSATAGIGFDLDNDGTDDFYMYDDGTFRPGVGSTTDANILVADGTKFNSVAMSGDVTTDNTGATTIGADKVHDSMVDWGSGANQVDLADIPGGVAGANAFDFGGASSFELANGSTATLDASGESYIDTDTDYFAFRGASSDRILSYKKSLKATIPSPANGDKILLVSEATTANLLRVRCFVDPADTGESVPYQLQECDSTLDNCANVDSEYTCDNDGYTDVTFTDSLIAGDGFLVANGSTATGTVTHAYIAVDYELKRE